MTLNGPEWSRLLATAAQLGELAPDRHSFLDKAVLLTGDEATLHSPNGQWCFTNALRLLGKMCRTVDVSVPSVCSRLNDVCSRIAAELAPTTIVRVGDFRRGVAFDVVLSVGNQTIKGLPWTAINSNGWLARVSSRDGGIDSACDKPNPIGAMAAACLGVAEVFKRLIRLKRDRGGPLPPTTFSLYSYSTDQATSGPDLPTLPAQAITLFGAGAIGNGIISLLRDLSWPGELDVVDRQDFGPENLGTCLLLTPSQIGLPKADWAEQVLKQAVRARGYPMDIKTFRQRIDAGAPLPRIILNGLDNVDARHLAQTFWPDIIIDGGIGPFSCQVSAHPWGTQTACLQCYFVPPSESADAKASAATGLPLDRVRRMEDPLIASDLEHAAPEKRPWLAGQVGRSVCSIVQEALARSISEEPVREGFSPSVPFVACMSAAMVVGELVKFLAGIPPVVTPAFQFDILRGPAAGQHVQLDRIKTCQCSQRTANINKWRGLQRGPRVSAPAVS